MTLDHHHEPGVGVITLAVMTDSQWTEYSEDPPTNSTIVHGPERVAPTVIPFCCFLYVIIFFCGLASNTWALRVSVIVLKCGGRNVNVLIYIAVLAFANLLVCATLPLTVTDLVAGEWIFPRFLCSAYWVLETVNKMGSSLILACLTVACYCAVCQPQMVRMYRCAVVACVHVVFAFAIVAWKAKSFVDGSDVYYVVHLHNDTAAAQVAEYTRKCVFMPTNDTDLVYHTVDIFLCGYALPMVYMFVFYAAILRAIIVQSQLLGRNSPPRHFWKAAKSASFLMAFHFFTWTPYWFVTLRLAFAQRTNGTIDNGLLDDKAAFHTTALIVHLLPLVNAAFSPLLYTLSNSHVRTLYKTATGAREQKNKIRRSMHFRQRAGTLQKKTSEMVQETML